MGVDQAGQHGHRAQIDHAGVARLGLHPGKRADGHDPVPLDQDAHIRLRLVGPPVDQAAGLDQNPEWWRWELGGEVPGEQQAEEQDGRSHVQISLYERGE
ncbi:MAG: hypothetical protein ACREMF_04940 [Gemmatimonadales bacterium]